MTDENVKQISKLLNSLITPVKEIVEVIKHKVDSMEFIQNTSSENMRTIRDQQLFMNKKLDILTEKLDATWEQTGKLSVDMTEVEEKLDSHTTILKKITTNTEHTVENVKKVNKRLTNLESKQGIVPPPELTIVV